MGRIKYNFLQARHTYCVLNGLHEYAGGGPMKRVGRLAACAVHWLLRLPAWPSCTHRAAAASCNAEYAAAMRPATREGGGVTSRASYACTCTIFPVLTTLARFCSSLVSPLLAHRLPVHSATLTQDIRSTCIPACGLPSVHGIESHTPNFLVFSFSFLT